MAETKDEIAAQRDQLRAENEQLRGQLVELAGRSPARVTFPARPAFGLSEGERQDLELHGVTSSPFDGSRILASDYDVDVLTVAGRKRLADEQARRAAAGDARAAVEGVDYVYPSVAPGVLADDAPVRGAVAETDR